MQLNAGDLFRQYRAIARVGEGGMGVVYRARDTKLDRDVALKFIVHAAGVNAERADRLRREARALAAPNHPSILTIHDIGEADGLPFLVLEWVGGGTLSDAVYAADADCVGVTKAIPWALNRQWLDLVARSGTALFVSLAPDCVDAAAARDLRAALALAAQTQPLGEPLDWQRTICPSRCDDRPEREFVPPNSVQT